MSDQIDKIEAEITQLEAALVPILARVEHAIFTHDLRTAQAHAAQKDRLESKIASRKKKLAKLKDQS